MELGNISKINSNIFYFFKVCEIPFNSRNKFQASIHKKDDKFLLVMKGAPEVIISRCSSVATDDGFQPMSKNKRQILKSILDLSSMGERVVGFAELKLPTDDYPPAYHFDVNNINFPLDGLQFVGLISMMDPHKLGVPEAVAKCKRAGIKVVMITGDHPVTAVTIAKNVGIISPESVTAYDVAIQKNISLTLLHTIEKMSYNAAVITGSEMRTMSPRVLSDIIEDYDEIVFARTSPQQKLLIVEAFQKSGEVVAVTGDGVNDSAALKKADIGIAMGRMGSDVSKEASDMILLDDDFSTIVTGIEEGRLIFDNLKKSIAYLLTSNVPELMPFILFIIIKIPSALSVIPIMVINIGTDLLPGISFAYEKTEADIMARRPRNIHHDRLVTIKLILFTYLQIGMIQACAGFTAYFFTMAMHGFFVERLVGLGDDWNDVKKNDLQDSYNYMWTYDERQVLQRKCYSSFFFAIVITQIADAIISKTRRLSIFQQRMTNWVLNFGLLFEVCLAIFVVFCPYVNHALDFEPIDLINCLISLPYGLLIIVYDEIRRLIIRKNSGGWCDKETYF